MNERERGKVVNVRFLTVKILSQRELSKRSFFRDCSLTLGRR